MAQPNVLVIDSDRVVRKLLKDELEQAGYQVWSTANPDESLELAKSISFGVVITDLKFSGIDSIDLIHKLAAANFNASIVAIVPPQFLKLAVEIMTRGEISDYLAKPFNIEEVKIVLKRAIDRKMLLRQAGQKELYQEMSIMDGLTGVYNRRYLDELLRREIERAKRYNQSISLLIMDVDNFKKYNDTYGHPAGDELLKNLAAGLTESVRTVDVVFRYGGEEFVVLMPQTLKHGAVEVAKRIINMARHNLPATLSLGISAYPEDAQTIEELLKKADAALYQAKTSGKDRFCLWGE